MSEMRVAAAEKMVSIVGSTLDPLDVVIGVACDETLDVQTRLGACSIALPYLYPRLSATQVAASHTVVKVDGNDLLKRLEDRLAKLSSAPAMIDVATPDAVEVA